MAEENPEKRVSQNRERSGDEDNKDGRDEKPESPEERAQRDEHERAKARRRELFRRPIVIAGLVALGLLVLIGVFLWWLRARQFESTDDAFIDTHLVRLAPQIPGLVSRIYITDNQRVHRGEPLIEIDSRDMRARLQGSQAEVSQAEAQRTQAQAQIAASEAQHRQAEAARSSAASQADIAERDLKRYRELQAVNPRAVSTQQLDQARSFARSAIAQRAAADAQVRAAVAQLDVARAEVTAAGSRIKSAAAQVAQAELNLGYTRLSAPIDGHIAQRSVAVGNYVSPGQQLLAIVPLAVWVTANFKETQLALMQPNQHATVHVDACPGYDLPAHIDSIQRGAGQAFALLPPENATGNFVKVVQRVPVKILLDRAPRDCPLGPGMSVVPKVRVR